MHMLPADIILIHSLHAIDTYFPGCLILLSKVTFNLPFQHLTLSRFAWKCIKNTTLDTYDSRNGAGLDNMAIDCLCNLIILLLKCHNFKSAYLTAWDCCMGLLHLSSSWVRKCTLSLTSCVFVVWKADAAICYSPLLRETLTVPQRHREPHNLSNTR